MKPLRGRSVDGQERGKALRATELGWRAVPAGPPRGRTADMVSTARMPAGGPGRIAMGLGTGLGISMDFARFHPAFFGPVEIGVEAYYRESIFLG